MAGWVGKWTKTTVIPIIVACVLPVTLPLSYIYALSRMYKKRTVDSVNCDCMCWDTVFKGPYEYDPLHYKHFYFNATKNTCKIWMVVVIGIIVLYESVRYLVTLLMRNNLRHSMFCLFMLSTFSHFYAWWTTIGYYNDSFYPQWNHQLFFTLTEMGCTAVVLYLASASRRFTFGALVAIISISFVHIIASSSDQFVKNVLRRKGKKHQIIRDVGLMLPDIMHIVVAIYHYWKVARRDSRMRLANNKVDMLFFIMAVMVATHYILSI